jgi:ABC-type phosphate/phosphonate transport system substrate-binding protein
VEEDPAATVVGYAALLAAVEKTINRNRTNAVHFEITLFKKNKDAIDALVNHKVDILKIGGNSYLKAKARDPHIRLLVSQNPPK